MSLPRQRQAEPRRSILRRYCTGCVETTERAYKCSGATDRRSAKPLETLVVPGPFRLRLETVNALTSEVLYQLSYVGKKACKCAFFLNQE